MKLYLRLAAGLVLFALGAVIGRESFPKHVDAEGGSQADQPPPRKSVRGERRRALTQGSEETPLPEAEAAPDYNATPTLSAILALAVPGDVFMTGNRMHAALQHLGADELESLFLELQGRDQRQPGFQLAQNNIFNHLALADPQRALRCAKKQSNRWMREHLTSIAIREWAKLDPAAARRAIEQISEANLRVAARRALAGAAIDSDPDSVADLMDTFRPDLVTRWAAKDPAAAEDYARSLKNAEHRAGALSAVAQGRAQADPEQALAWARGLDHADARQRALTGVLNVIARNDPQRVAGMLDEISSFTERNSIISTVTSAWINKDQTATVEWLDSLPDNQAKFQGYRTAINQITQRDPADAAELLDRLPLHDVHRVAGEIAGAWARQDLQAARRWVASLENPVEISSAVSSMLNVWSTEDPATAVEYLEGEASALPMPNRDDLYNNLANQWSQRDPAASLDWAQGIADDARRNRALSSVYNNWAIHDPSAAAERLTTLNDPAEREMLVNSLASNWPGRDPEAALDWFDQLSNEDRASAGSRVLQSLTHRSPQDASKLFDLLITHANEESARNLINTVGGIARHWSENDPVAAAQWAAQIEDEEGQQNAVEQVSNHWVRFDPVNAAEWIGELPDGSLRDRAVRPLVNQIAGVDPPSAFAWAQTIGDDTRRFQAIENVIQQWKRFDRDAAREAANTAEVSPDQRQKLREHLR